MEPKKPIEQTGFILPSGQFITTANEETLNDWEAWRADEMAIDYGLEYARLGRLDDPVKDELKKHRTV